MDPKQRMESSNGENQITGEVILDGGEDDDFADCRMSSVQSQADPSHQLRVCNTSSSWVIPRVIDQPGFFRRNVILDSNKQVPWTKPWTWAGNWSPSTSNKLQICYTIFRFVSVEYSFHFSSLKDRRTVADSQHNPSVVTGTSWSKSSSVPVTRCSGGIALSTV